MHDILGRCPDLVNGFNEFLARCEAMDIDLGEATRSKDGKLSIKDVQKMKVTEKSPASLPTCIPP